MDAARVSSSGAALAAAVKTQPLGGHSMTTSEERDLMERALFECPDGDPHHVQAAPDDWNVEGLPLQVSGEQGEYGVSREVMG